MPVGVYPRPSIEERFWRNVEKIEDGCWIWKGYKNRSGYGLIKMNGKYLSTHRLSFRWLKGEIPEGLTIDHLCRNHACVNPEHLQAVTLKVNLLRGIGFAALNSKKTHCPKGHPLSGNNLATAFLKKGARRCKICALESTRRWRTKNSEHIGRYNSAYFQSEKTKRE